MIKLYPIKPSKRAEIHAVTHVDGSGRLQITSKKDTPLHWQLIKVFENISGVPVALNTSFNENEPIARKPSEAFDCFLRAEMDVLVLRKFFINRNKSHLYNME